MPKPGDSPCPLCGQNFPTLRRLQNLPVTEWKHVCLTLTLRQVRAILALASQGPVNERALAREYGVTLATIHLLIRHRDARLTR